MNALFWFLVVFIGLPFLTLCIIFVLHFIDILIFFWTSLFDAIFKTRLSITYEVFLDKINKIIDRIL